MATITMGSADAPVILDPAQIITQVHWKKKPPDELTYIAFSVWVRSHADDFTSLSAPPPDAEGDHPARPGYGNGHYWPGAGVRYHNAFGDHLAPPQLPPWAARGLRASGAWEIISLSTGEITGLPVNGPSPDWRWESATFPAGAVADGFTVKWVVTGPSLDIPTPFDAGATFQGGSAMIQLTSDASYTGNKEILGPGLGGGYGWQWEYGGPETFDLATGFAAGATTIYAGDQVFNYVGCQINRRTPFLSNLIGGVSNTLDENNGVELWLLFEREATTV